MTVTSSFTEIDQPKENTGERELTFSIEVSPNATDELCGKCMFIDCEGSYFCRLFGCETLHRYPDGTFRRTGLCRHFERTRETVTAEDQKP